MQTFKIYPVDMSGVPYHHKLDKTLWWKVRIFESREDFKKNINVRMPTCDKNKCLKNEDHRDAAGVTHLHSHRGAFDIFGQVHGVKSVKGEIGVISLYRNALTPEIVSHECTHAMFKTATRFTNVINLAADWNLKVGWEEYCCYMLGRYVDQIVRKTSKKK